MDTLLTSKQVQELLKVDRITVYRMLQDGRLKGIKIGQQWRFPLKEVEHLLEGVSPPQSAPEPVSKAAFPVHCVQVIQNLFADLSRVSALVIDCQGKPLTEVSNPCAFCAGMLAKEPGRLLCQSSWQETAQQAAQGEGWTVCPLGFSYRWAIIRVKDEAAAVLLAGPCRGSTADSRLDERNFMLRAESLALPFELSWQDYQRVPLCDADRREMLQEWPAKVARAIESILQERCGFLDRLEKISQISSLD